MDVAVLITGIASAVALIGTLLLVARQARSLAVQTELANKLAVHSATNDPLVGLRLIYSMYVEHPEVYRYFYDGAHLQQAEEHDELGVRVKTIAELMADTLELALETTEAVGVPERDRIGWEDTIDGSLSLSPTLQALVAAQPTVWPCLSGRLRSLTPASSSSGS